MKAKRFIFIGSLSAAIAVIFGAFGAHYVRSQISHEMLAVYQTGVQYHMYHSLALIAIGLIIKNIKPSALLQLAGWVMLFGMVMFSGSLYVLSITQIRWLGFITPIGGTAFVVAWVMTAIGVIK